MPRYRGVGKGKKGSTVKPAVRDFYDKAGGLSPASMTDEIETYPYVKKTKGKKPKGWKNDPARVKSLTKKK